MQEIGVIILYLFSGHTLLLRDVVYVPSMSKNLISVSTLDNYGYTFESGNGKLVYFDSVVVGPGILCDRLYKLYMNDMSVNSVVAQQD